LIIILHQVFCTLINELTDRCSIVEESPLDFPQSNRWGNFPVQAFTKFQHNLKFLPVDQYWLFVPSSRGSSQQFRVMPTVSALWQLQSLKQPLPLIPEGQNKASEENRGAIIINDFTPSHY